MKHGIKADFIGQPGNATDVIAKLDDSGGFDLLVMGSVATRRRCCRCADVPGSLPL